jgi:hypothetical protein
MVGGKQPTVEEFMKLIQEAVDAGDASKAAELYSEMLTIAEKTGQIDRATSQRIRLDLAAQMIRSAPASAREKVTLSLPEDVLQALRLASAESGKEMSQVVSEALRTELVKYTHASQALRKAK